MEALFTNVTRFNTSHVTLYLQNVDYGKMAKGFQYISCYSLSQTQFPRQAERNVSIHLMLLFIGVRGLYEMAGICFNTSHVTLYLIPDSATSVIFTFQYISCYSLSTTEYNASYDTSQFQYISCYSLSQMLNAESERKIRFNTSHVTLYPTVDYDEQLFYC